MFTGQLLQPENILYVKSLVPAQELFHPQLPGVGRSVQAILDAPVFVDILSGAVSMRRHHLTIPSTFQVYLQLDKKSSY